MFKFPFLCVAIPATFFTTLALTYNAAHASDPQTWSCTMSSDFLILSGEPVTKRTCSRYGWVVEDRVLRADEAPLLARCNNRRYYWDNEDEFPGPCDYVIENPYQIIGEMS